MINMTLKRIHASSSGVFGVLEYKYPFAVTLELPWRDNKQYVSCIPAGDYKCVRVNSPKFGAVFGITNVHDRSNILIHWGNFLSDIAGCLLVAEKFGKTSGEPSVLTSRNIPGEGFNEFMDLLKGVDAFWLSIQWHCDFNQKEAA